MHLFARVLAVAYLVLAAASGIIYVQTSINYVNVAEINVNISGNVAVTGVVIVWNRTSGADPVLLVTMTATNPGRIPIEVTNVDFGLHMDDPWDASPWFDAASLPRTLIRSGGFTTQPGHGIVIPPGETRVVESVVPVQGVDQMNRFDRPDAAGRYYPVVWAPRFIYFFVGFDLFTILELGPYYDPMGVVPVG